MRESEKRARVFLNATMDGAALVDRQGIIIDLNEAMAESIGKSVEDLIGQSLFGTFPDEVTDKRRSYVAQVARTGVPARFTDERRGRWFESNHYPVFGEDGKVVQVAVFARNITSQKRAERKLIEAKEEADEANRAPAGHQIVVQSAQQSPAEEPRGIALAILAGGPQKRVEHPFQGRARTGGTPFGLGLTNRQPQTRQKHERKDEQTHDASPHLAAPTPG